MLHSSGEKEEKATRTMITDLAINEVPSIPRQTTPPSDAKPTTIDRSHDSRLISDTKESDAKTMI